MSRTAFETQADLRYIQEYAKELYEKVHNGQIVPSGYLIRMKDLVDGLVTYYLPKDERPNYWDK